MAGKRATRATSFALIRALVRAGYGALTLGELSTLSPAEILRLTLGGEA